MIVLGAGEVLKDIFGMEVLIVVHKLILETQIMQTQRDSVEDSLDYYSDLFPRDKEPSKITLNEKVFKKITSKFVTMKLIDFLHNLFETNFNSALNKTKNTVIFIEKLCTFY